MGEKCSFCSRNTSVCLFVRGLSSHSRISHSRIFTHMHTSPLPLKGYKFWPMLGTHDHWAVRVLWRATHTVTRGIRLWWSSPSTRDIDIYCRAFSRRAATSCFYDLGLLRLRFEHPTFRLRGQRSNPLRHHRGEHKWILLNDKSKWIIKLMQIFVPIRTYLKLSKNWTKNTALQNWFLIMVYIK